MDWMRDLQEELSKTPSDPVSEQQPKPTPAPKVASTDRREVSEGERTKKETSPSGGVMHEVFPPMRSKNPTQSWIYSMPNDASDFEWWVEFIANCETNPLKSYENAQRVEEVELL